MSANLSLLTDGLLALLLAVTIGYAIVLNRKLSALRNLRGDMEQAVARFAETTQLAESGLVELRDRAEVLSGELREQVGSAAERLDGVRGLNEDLRFLVEKGEALADRLERAVAAGRHLSAPVAATGQQSARPAPGGEMAAVTQLRAERPRHDAATRTMAAAPARSAQPAPAAAETASADPSRRELINALDAIR